VLLQREPIPLGLLVTRSTFTPASASTVTLALHLKLGE
jgi:hypothetical protein